MTRRRDARTLRQVAVVGVGLIGGSVVAALKAAHPELVVVGIDRGRRPDPRAVPLDAFTRSLRGVAGADLVVLAAPVDVNQRLLEQVVQAADADATLTDVGSTKRPIVARAAALGVDRRFIGGHPVAGLAVTGAKHASATLFRAAPWVLTPSHRAAPTHVARAKKLVAVTGARTVVLSAAEHDRALAYVSHLPQVVASCLMETVGRAVGVRGLSVSGPGLFDTTRLAASDASLWTAILRQNADHVGAAIRHCLTALAELERRLHAGEDPTRLFDRAQEWRARLERLHAPRRAARRGSG